MTATQYRDILLKAKRDGLTTQEMANLIHKSRRTVVRYLTELNLTKVVTIDDNEVLRLYNDEHLTCNEIAKRLNVSHGVVTASLDRLQVQYSRADNIKKHFKRVHQEKWPEIEQMLNDGVSVVNTAKQFHMRVDNLRQLMRDNHYKQRLTIDLSDVEDALAQAQTLSVRSRKTQILYLTAILDYVDRFGQRPTGANLADFMNKPLMTVSSYFKSHQLSYLLRPGRVISTNVQVLCEWLSVHHVDFELNNRTLLDGLEIDVWVPSWKIGFEVNPVSTHSVDSKWGLSSKSYHQEKSLCALDKGIALVHLYDYDFEDAIWSKLQLQFDRFLARPKCIGARKMRVCEISRTEANQFLDLYHLQGAEYNSSYQIGLYYNDELVSVMTFGRPRYHNDMDWELIRYCASPKIGVIGGFEKLLAHFRSRHHGRLLSYMDLNKRFTASNVYEKSGFRCEGVTSPNYSWIQYNTHKRLKRYDTTKAKLIKQGYSAELSEKEIMLSRNYRRVFDAGSMIYVL